MHKIDGRAAGPSPLISPHDLNLHSLPFCISQGDYVDARFKYSILSEGNYYFDETGFDATAKF
jgi:hypothetical protein